MKKNKFKEDCDHMVINEDSIGRKKRICYEMMARLFYGSSLCLHCGAYKKKVKK